MAYKILIHSKSLIKSGGFMANKRKKLYMLLYSKLVRAGYYNSARNLLHNLIGFKNAKQYLPNIQFWCIAYDINLKEWFKNG